MGRSIGLARPHYIAAYTAIQPINPHAVYIQAEGAVSTISWATILEAIEQV
jgi:hypothetical protein